MEAFRYKGYQSGKKVDGQIHANSIEEAERKLQSQGVTVIALLPAGRAASKPEAERPSFTSKRKRVSLAHLASLLHDLGVMAEAGVPFVEALDAASEASPNAAVREVIRSIREEVVGGKSLSVAMRASGAFPDVVCELVHVAEEGCRLDHALRAGSTYLERTVEMRKRLINALMYPCVLMLVAILTGVVLVAFVLPKFSSIFDKMGAQIPITTKWMLAAGTTLRNQPYLGLGGLVAAVLGLRYVYRLASSSRPFSAFLLKLPVLGDLIARLALARAFQSIATLISSNVPLVVAVEQGARVSGNPIIREALLAARAAMEHGAAFSEAAKEQPIIPRTLTQMIAVGERTGQLPRLMNSTASAMEEDVDARLKALVSIVEPVMVVAMGAFVGTITLSIIIPIYTVVQNIR